MIHDISVMLCSNDFCVAVKCDPEKTTWWVSITPRGHGGPSLILHVLDKTAAEDMAGAFRRLRLSAERVPA